MSLYCILDSKAMKKQNSWIHTKENWGWSEQKDQARQMLQGGN